METKNRSGRLVEGAKPSKSPGTKPAEKIKPLTFRGGVQPKAPAGPKPAVKPGPKK